MPKTPRNPRISRRKYPIKKSKKWLKAEEEAVAKENARMNSEYNDLEDFQLMTDTSPRDFYTMDEDEEQQQERPTSPPDSLLPDVLTDEEIFLRDAPVHTAASIQKLRNSFLRERQILRQPTFDSSSITMVKDGSIQQSSVIQNISERNEVVEEVSIHNAAPIQRESPLRTSIINNQQISTTSTKSISIVEESQKENIQDEAILISDESQQNILEDQSTSSKKKKRRQPGSKRKKGKNAAKQAKNGLKSYCYNIKKTMEDDKLKDKISEDDKKKVLDKCQETRSWLDANQTAKKDEYEHHQKELEAICNPIIH